MKVFVNLPVYNVPVKDFVKVVTVVLRLYYGPPGGVINFILGAPLGPPRFYDFFNFFIKIIKFHLFYLPLPVVTGTTGLYDGYDGYDGCSLYTVEPGECISIDLESPLLKG